MVEGAVKLIYRSIFAQLQDHEFHDLETLNAAIRGALESHNSQLLYKKEYSRRDQFEEIEQEMLQPLHPLGFEMKKQIIVNKVVGSMQGKLNVFKENEIKAFQSLKDEIPGLSRAIALVKNSFALAIAGVVALGTAFVKATKMANNWREQIEQINVTAGENPERLKKISDELLKIGDKILEVIAYFKEQYKNSALLRDIISRIGSVFKTAFMNAIAPIKLVINLIKGLWDNINLLYIGLNSLFAKITGIQGGFKEAYEKIRPYFILISQSMVRHFVISLLCALH